MKTNSRLRTIAVAGAVIVSASLVTIWLWPQQKSSQNEAEMVGSTREEPRESKAESPHSTRTHSRRSPDELAAMRNRLAYYRSLIPSQEEMAEENRRELQNSAKNLLDEAEARGKWSESDAVNLFAVHEQLSEEEVHASLQRLQSLLASGRLRPGEPTP